MDKLEKWIRIRIRLAGFCFLIVFSFIVVRAFQLQVLGQEEWRKRADRQHQKSVPLTPKRGTIYDQGGEELALSIEVDSIYLEPTKIAEPEKVVEVLAKTLTLPKSSLREKVRSKKSFLWVKRQISQAEGDKIRAAKLAGVGFTKEHRRFYPNSELGAHVLGFTGIDPKGLEGLELKYDGVVQGEGGYLVVERDALGRGLGSGSLVVEGSRHGGDLYLTLDKHVQYIAEKELAEGVAKAGAKGGSAVVMDPRTGRILAMANSPLYNPNAINNYRPSHWRNRAVCDTYEPGSTLKVFLMAAALNEKLVTPNQIIDCEKGSYRVGGRTIHDHHPYGRITASEVIKVSSNIGAAKIGKALERDRLYRYLTDFGFGRPTGIDLPGEASGLLRPPNAWFEVDLAAISFGQGMTATPLQLARATAAIANGGKLIDMPIVERIVNNRGDVIEERKPEVVRQVVSPEVARQVREMMALVVGQGGTGTLASVPGFKVAGKTGTAQKVDPVTGGYSVDKRVASFIGMVPAESPKLVVVVEIDEPSKQVYGGLVAAPVFSEIATQTLRQLKISPTEATPAMPLPLPPAAEALAQPVQAMLEAPAEGEPQMPDFAGMSYRQVLQTMAEKGLNIKLRGSGRVIEQSPPPGEAIRYSKEVWVRLAPPT
ncbi:MAG: penicillin-binding protein [Trichloromonas sp.]|jgi:cell division protein FtsI (penicillin-binding protein 3)|nr:penicillin-binding protein [Trichloromonas sp.]